MGIPLRVEKVPDGLRAGERRAKARSGLLRTEHLCRYPRDEPARHQSFALGAKVVAQPGDDIALACRECLQTVAGDSFSGLRASLRMSRMSGDFMKFGSGGAGT